MTKGLQYFYLVLIFFAAIPSGFSQNPCDPITPVFNVNLAGNPNGTWTSTPVPRAGNCCGTLPPDKCIEFIITLDSAAVAINFQIVAGAVPPGALYYQIGCGPQIPVGSPICLNGPGPYVLTFCKPGNNINTYAITSIAAPEVSPDDTIGNGCSTVMHASGLLVNSSITWTSIAPGAPGTYNSYLSCTVGCDSTTVTAQPGAPAYVDYVVCGQPAAGACVSSSNWCDTIRIYFTPPIVPVITPNPANFCANNPGITLSSTVSGGAPPYTYAWINSSGTVVGTGSTYTATTSGNYTLTIYDQNYPECPAQNATVTVTQSPVPVVNAGPDQNICGTSVTLNGTVTGATGLIWSGGNGTFTPNNTTGSAVYTPTATELNTGTVILTLTSTGNGACNPVTDQVVINISPPVAVTITAPAVVCFGQTATLTANASGGIPPYNYLWSNGANTQTISNMAPGTYSVSVTGSTGATCIATATVTIAGNPQIILTTSPNNSISCSTTASISASASGGSGAFTYLWSNGATTPSTNVYSGTYAITVTDALGCTANGSVSVIAANSSLTASINQPPVLCNGATTTLNAVANGGFGNYTYSWNTGATTPSIVAGAGSYCCTITDGAGCLTSACVTVAQNPPLNLSVPAPSSVCFGSSGVITAYPSGGQAPYTYSWSNGQITQSITAPAGNYTVTVTDMIGCTAASTVTLVQTTLLTATPFFTPPGCFGSSNGTATANASGGTAPYFYSWSPFGGSSSTATGLSAGTYSVTITDTKGCATTATVTVTQPAPIAATISVNNNVSCNGGSNGSATVNVSGGTPAYSYSWSPSGGNGASANTLSAGAYFVTVSDVNGCTQTAQTNITQPLPLTGSVATTNNVSCNGGNDGSGIVSASGGTPSFSYSWAPFGGTGSGASGLTPGTYTVTVLDGGGCSTLVNVVITQPPALSATIGSVTNVSCSGGSNGSATANVTGGTAPYTYSWNSTPVQTSQTANNLPAGTYSVTVTDSKGCVTTSAGITITQPVALTISATPNTFISCTNTVSISASAAGGTPGYSYLWSTGANTTAITVNTGTYSVTATDALGCTATTSVSVQASNSTLGATINTPSNICNGSTTTVSVIPSGGFGGYTYLWGNGSVSASTLVGAGNHCVTITDAGGCVVSACVTVTQNPPLSVSIGTPSLVCPGGSTGVTATGSGGQSPYNFLWSTGQTTSSITGPAGNYTVTISDATGATCTATASVTVSQEPQLVLSMGSTNVGCFGAANGSGTVYASGGMPSYTYSWMPYGGTNSIATNLGPGTFSVIVTDAIGCTQTGTVSISQPASAVQLTTTSTNVLCFGQSTGTATASGSGGMSPYYYYWFINGSSSSTINGLSAGTYSVTVADSTGCYTSSSVSVNQPPDITLSGLTTPVTCGYNNGTASVSVTGGTGAYSYSWSPSGGAQSTASNLSTGNYTVTVSDANNCQKQLGLNVGAILSTYAASFSSGQTCLNSPSGYTDLSSVTNDSITSYFWDFGEPVSGSNNISSTQNPSHTYGSAGTFTTTLVITTQNGCSDTAAVAVTVNPAPALSFVTDSVCTQTPFVFVNTSGVNPGSISSWSWNFGDPGSGINNTSTLQNPSHTFALPGTYQVSLSGVTTSGCSDTLTQNIVVTPVPNVSFTTNTVCQNNPTQFTDATTSGSGNIVAWSWNFGDSSPADSTQNPSHIYNTGGTFNAVLTVVSSNGCQASDTLPVTVFALPVVSFNAPDVCLNNPTLFVDQSTVPFGSITSWAWDFGNFSPVNNSQSPNYVYAASGTFNVTLTVTSNNGCTSTVTKPVSVFPLPLVNFSNTIACVNSPTQFTSLATVGGGGTISSWLWAFGDGSPITTSQNPAHTYSVSGTYNVSFVASSGNGCSDTITKPVIVNPSPLAQFVVFDSSGCATYCTQFADASIPNGGTITNWEWDFGDSSLTGTTTGPTHCYQNSGVYTITLTVTTSNGCKATNTQTNLITVYPVPVAEFSLSPQPTTTLNADIYFTDLSIDAVAWEWDFGDPSNSALSYLQNPTHFYTDSGNYCVTLTVENAYQCRDTAVHCLIIDPEFTFYIPNAFTPEDSEGVNDQFSGVGTNIKEYDMWIFDRWGNMIFHTNSLSHKWDGRANEGKEIAQQDVYVYLVVLKDMRGNEHKYRGHVTLVR